MLHLHQRRNGNEAKSAIGKVLARTPTALKLGAIMAFITAITLFSLICFTDFKRIRNDTVVNANELQKQELKPMSNTDQQENGDTAGNNAMKTARPRRRNNGQQSAVKDKKGRAVNAVREVPDKVVKENDLRLAHALKGLKQSQNIGQPEPKPDYDYLLTSDRHIYTGVDIPYFNEDVPAFRSRVSKLLSTTKKNSIFVSLGSFRDDLCPATLVELFQKAKHPHKIFIGLVDQVKLSADSDDVACDSTLPSKYRQQVRLVRLTSLEGQGPTHARYIASKLYEGEQYYMQIDSHSHFKQDWDVNIIQQLTRLPNPSRSIITHYPPGDVSELTSKNPPWICSNRQHKDAPPGLLVQESDWCYPENRSPGVAVASDGSLTICVSPFMGGGFIVGPGSWVVDIPYDKYIPYIFHGEELLIAARLWTSGWDMFTPSESILDHKYGGRDKNVYAETNTWMKVGELSTARARHILGTALPGDDQIHFDKSELQYLSMGSERSYADYLEFAGINLKGNSTGRCGQRYNWEKKVWEGKVKLMTG